MISPFKRRTSPAPVVVYVGGVFDEDGECERCPLLGEDIADALRLLENDHGLICQCNPCEARRALEKAQLGEYPLRAAARAS